MFVHLRLHTEFSVVDGTNRIDDVVAAAAAPTASRADGRPALRPKRRDATGARNPASASR
jgi:hypothetical protein